MAGYNTEQKKCIIQFLSDNCNASYTIEELIANLEKCDNISKAPGRSTVYRLMNKLVEEGIVKRFIKGHSRHFYYQIMESTNCHEHIHMKCTSCGKLFHMADDETTKLLNEILTSSHFTVDRDETTLYGTCDNCIR
ncbi:MAG: Fur family transcriptional regulator [Lachnospiraceae bacterium]|nr:Fur family transcriptional regulator [Lachnospiraceae bacterium]